MAGRWSSSISSGVATTAPAGTTLGMPSRDRFALTVLPEMLKCSATCESGTSPRSTTISSVHSIGSVGGLKEGIFRTWRFNTAEATLIPSCSATFRSGMVPSRARSSGSQGMADSTAQEGGGAYGGSPRSSRLRRMVVRESPSSRPTTPSLSSPIREIISGVHSTGPRGGRNDSIPRRRRSLVTVPELMPARRASFSSETFPSRDASSSVHETMARVERIVDAGTRSTGSGGATERRFSGRVFFGGRDIGCRSYRIWALQQFPRKEAKNAL